MFSRLNRCAEEVNKAAGGYRFHEVAQTLWHFVWGEFCDWYVELKKLRFTDNSGLNAHWRNLMTVFESMLRLLHPVMPFVTEELWQRIAAGKPGRPASIALATYPRFDAASSDPAAEAEIALLQDVITAARALRADAKLDPKQQLEAVLYIAAPVWKEAIERLANLNLTIADPASPRAAGPARSTTQFDLVIQVPAGALDVMRARLVKEI